MAMTQTLNLCTGDTIPARSWTSPPSWWPGQSPSRGWRSASPASPSQCRRGWSTGPSPGTSATSGCTAAPAPGPGAASPSSTRTPPTARACASWTRGPSQASSKSVSRSSYCRVIHCQSSLPSIHPSIVCVMFVRSWHKSQLIIIFMIKQSQRCCAVRQKVHEHINLLFRESHPAPPLLPEFV